MENLEMKKSEKAAWTAALRSGDYPQGCGSLRNLNGPGYCCLGVGAPIGFPGGHWVASEWDLGNGRHMGAYGVVRSNAATNESFGTLFDLPVDTLQHLVRMNDGVSQTFASIANWIDANIPTED